MLGGEPSGHGWLGRIFGDLPVLPTSSVIDYSDLLEECSTRAGNQPQASLDVLSSSWVAAYKRQINRKTNITEMIGVVDD